MPDCDGTGREPVAPDLVAFSGSASSIVSELGAIGDDSELSSTTTAATLTLPGGRASGHADVFASPRQNVVEQAYSFTALSVGAFPEAKGEFEGHALRFTGEIVDVHAHVTCIAIVGKQAWVGARITRATVDQVEVPNSAGTPLTFRVQDSGDGTNVDVASLWALSSSEISFCNTRPTTNALRESVDGNIQVHPQ
jgi:hypothetical protein